MSPDPIKKESALEHAVDKWTESNRKLESHGNQFGLAPLYKVIALKQMMVGRAKEHFDLWEADHKHEADDDPVPDPHKVFALAAGKGMLRHL